MKKFLLFLISIVVLNIPVCYAYTSGFEYMLDAMGIEKINVNGFEINEYIYEKYKLIVYGDPIVVNHPKQRWKIVGNGNWNNAGEMGEFWILGQDYSGKLVHNELFPDDYNSGTSPLNWNYRVVKDAEESWNDTSLYMYESQREYMLTQKLSRFGVTYDLTALDIGLDKAKVENYATWGNAGSIYTEKPGEGKIYWAATFNVQPMAGDAKLNSILEFPYGTEYTMEKNVNSIEIPYVYGAEILGLSEYAKAEHIKIIETEVKVDSIRNGIVSGAETLEIAQNGNLIINRNEYEGMDKIVLKVETNSFASTYFPNDSIMYASDVKTITINLKNEEYISESTRNDKVSPTIYSITIKRVSVAGENKNGVVDLYMNKKTKRKFICAGQIIQIDVKTSVDAVATMFSFNGLSSISTLDDTTKKFLWDEPIERKERLIYSDLKKLENAFDLPRGMQLVEETETYNLFSGIYVIPYETTQTLHSWNSLRSISKDAFDIDESKLFTPIRKPYELVIEARSYRGSSYKTYSLDVAERWDLLFNRDISKYISR